MLKNLFLALLFLTFQTQFWAQIPTTQDCLGAVPVCAQVYVESTAPSGFGNYAGEIDPSISCVFDDNNSIWYTFTINSSGNFGFVLTPNDLNDDYDWALYNITTANCADISRIPELLVSCNAAGSGLCQGVTGANGNSQYDIQGGGCESNFPDENEGQSAFNDFIPVEEGNSYALMVSNWTGSTNGYEIDFGVSEDIGIIDRTPPKFKTAAYDQLNGCSPTEITLEFSEFIQCSSIDLSNFELQDSDGNLYDIMFSSPICDVGGEYSRSFLITLMEPLPRHNESYTLYGNIQENYKILDVCDNEGVPFTTSFSVVYPQLGEITLPDDTLICDMPNFTLDAFDPAALNYLWEDGTTSSDIIISNSGIYRVTISNICEEQEAIIEVLFINSKDESVNLGPDRTLCDGSSYIIDPKLDINYDYLWNDGNTNRIRNLAESGTFSVTVTNECGIIGEDEIIVEFKDRSLSVDLGESTLLCIGETLSLSAEHPNGVDYRWNDGSTDPTLSVISGGLYSVTVSNECGSTEGEVVINESSCIECHVYIPNSMAPNGPSGNSELRVTSNCRLESYRIRVFDRWGAEVFFSDDPTISWQGFGASNSQIESGVYIYVIRYSYFEFNELVEKVTYGDVLVIH